MYVQRERERERERERKKEKQKDACQIALMLDFAHLEFVGLEPSCVKVALRFFEMVEGCQYHAHASRRNGRNKGRQPSPSPPCASSLAHVCLIFASSQKTPSEKTNEQGATRMPKNAHPPAPQTHHGLKTGTLYINRTVAYVLMFVQIYLLHLLKSILIELKYTHI